MGLTAVILTNKEAKDIKKTIASVSFADEIILVRDLPQKPMVIEKDYSIYFRPLDNNFAVQRNFGLSKAKQDWVLFVDDDEVVSEKLAEEIRQAIKTDRYFGYFLHRLDRYLGEFLRHGETGNIKIVRLAKKSAGTIVRPVHESWQISGSVGELNSPLFHERGELTGPFIDRMVHYGPIDAKELEKEGKPFSFWRLLLNPLAKFIVNYKLKLGFLDGYPGLFQAYLMSVQSLSVRIFQWQKH